MLMSEQYGGAQLVYKFSFYSLVITLFPETFKAVFVCVDDVDNNEFWHSSIPKLNVKRVCGDKKAVEILFEMRGKYVNVQCSVHTHFASYITCVH